MSQQQREKFTARTTPENTDDVLKLTLEELSAISGGRSTADTGDPEPDDPDG